jgi:hypothetical protein
VLANSSMGEDRTSVRMDDDGVQVLILGYTRVDSSEDSMAEHLPRLSVNIKSH